MGYYKIKIDKDTQKEALKVLELLTNERKSYKEIAKIFGKSPSYYCHLMKKFKKEVWHFDGVLTKYHWFKITGKIEKIKKLYIEDRMSTIKIAELYNLTDHTIANYLRKENIKIRDTGHESRTNQDIFNNIDNEIKAYCIGLITADGNITQDRKSLTITLTNSDKYLLDQINEQLLNGTGHIIVCNKKRGKPVAVLQFHGKKMCQSVEKHGIVPCKSDYLTELSHYIPLSLYHHYIRGLYDGDGVCAKGNKRIRVGYCAKQKEFTQNYRDFLNKTLNMPKNKLFNTGGCWQVSWGAKKDLENFYNYIYKDATIFLGRKKNKLYTYLNQNQVNTEIN